MQKDITLPWREKFQDIFTHAKKILFLKIYTYNLNPKQNRSIKQRLPKPCTNKMKQQQPTATSSYVPTDKKTSSPREKLLVICMTQLPDIQNINQDKRKKAGAALQLKLTSSPMINTAIDSWQKLKILRLNFITGR